MSQVTNPSSSTGSTGSYILSWVSTIVWRSTTVVVGLGAVLATFLYFKQDSMLYFPEIGGIPRRPAQNPRRYRSPSEYQIPFESHMIPCSDGVNIHAWLLFRDTNTSNKLPTLMFFHGNAGNIGLRLPNAAQMLQHLGVNVFMVEYRGYGDSDSVSPTEAGLRLDAEAALQFLAKHPKVDPTKIFVFGRSLGGAVSMHLAQYAQAQQLPLAGVIVENTFTSISEMVDHLMPMIAPFKALVLRIGWKSIQIVPNLQMPILYLAGAKDQLVPHSHMLRLHDSSTRSFLRKIHVIKDGTHNETWLQGGMEYWMAIREFIAQSIQQTPFQPTVESDVAIDQGGDATVASNILPMMPSNLLNLSQESMRNKKTPDKKEL